MDGTIVFFNEAEATASLTEDEEEYPQSRRPKKTKVRRAENIRVLPAVTVEHMMSEEELREEFGENGWYRLKDEIYSRYKFIPAKAEIKEHHVGVYKSKKITILRKQGIQDTC